MILAATHEVIVGSSTMFDLMCLYLLTQIKQILFLGGELLKIQDV